MRPIRESTFPYRLDPYQNTSDFTGKRPLIVIHGYSAKMYPMQWLMNLLADQLPQLAIYQYSFETFSGLVSNRTSLEEASRILGTELVRVKKEHNLAEGVLFVGHSTGGLIARRCFIDHQSQLGKGAFVFLGTPQFGAEIADLKNLFTLAYREKQTRELTVGSDFIWRLNRDWMRLADGTVEATLCVIGTKSDRSALGRLPKGAWVQSDGVVRSTSATLAARGNENCMLLHVPLVHGELKDLAPEWRRIFAFSKEALDHSLIPARDLPFIATIAFFRYAQQRKFDELDINKFWDYCLSYMEACELSFRKTLLREYQEDLDYFRFGISDPANSRYCQLPDQPTFEKELDEYQQQAYAFWGSDNFGSAIIRLDYLDIPPDPEGSSRCPRLIKI